MDGAGEPAVEAMTGAREPLFLLAAALALAMILGLVLWPPGLSATPTSYGASALEGRDGVLATFGKASVSWTSANLMDPPGGRLAARRLLVTPLSCDPDRERSTWQIILARAFQDQAARAPASTDAQAAKALSDFIQRQAGKALGATDLLVLGAGHPLRRLGIDGLLSICTPSRRPAAEDEIAEAAQRLIRQGRRALAQTGSVQLALPRIPVKLTSAAASGDRGAVLFWKAALVEARSGLKPGQGADVLFGLYALGDGGRANRQAFAQTAGEILADAPPKISKLRGGAVLGGVCFAAGSLAAWARRRPLRLDYLVALLALSSTGAAGLLNVFSLGDLGALGLPGPTAFLLTAVLMAVIGVFAERAARFDWRAGLGRS